jgi:chromosome segregation ATPase
MTREELTALGLNKEQIDGVLNKHHEELEAVKNASKEFEEKAKEVETLKETHQKEIDELNAKLEESNKNLETYKGFEDKAKKFDEINPKYEEYVKDAKHRSLVEKAKGKGIAEEFIDFALSKVGDNEEELENNLDTFVKENPRMLTSNFTKSPTNPELIPGAQKSREQMSDEEYLKERIPEINKAA